MLTNLSILFHVQNDFQIIFYFYHWTKSALVERKFLFLLFIKEYSTMVDGNLQILSSF